jgi:hypothetical protein
MRGRTKTGDDLCREIITHALFFYSCYHRCEGCLGGKGQIVGWKPQCSGIESVKFKKSNKANFFFGKVLSSLDDDETLGITSRKFGFQEN